MSKRRSSDRPLSAQQQLLLAALLAYVAKQPPAVYCERCGQELTDPASAKAGIGPICIHKRKEEEGFA